MTKLKEGVNGSYGSARYFEVFEAGEIWRREHGTPIRAAYDYWLSCRREASLPRVSAVDDRRFGALGWRFRKIDVRGRHPGKFAVVSDRGADVVTLQRSSALGGFHRDCLTLDLSECLDRRAALYVVADYLDGEAQYQCREALFPLVDDTGAIAWVHHVEVHDDENDDTLRSASATMNA